MDYEGFKRGILSISGINLDFYKERQMKRRIDSLMNRNSYYDYGLYLEQLQRDKRLYDEFVNYLTINVSEFYRNPEQWENLETKILPGIIKSNKSPKIWSCACSTGEEPYTMAMILSKHIPFQNINIIATDIDTGAIQKAKEGLYSAKSLETVPEDYVKRFFTKVNNEYMISDELKKCLTFKRLDLFYDEYPDNCDLIICRNVLIYFTSEAKNMIYRKLYHALKKGGILFVGSTEQIIMPHKYGFCPVKTFFYTKE